MKVKDQKLVANLIGELIDEKLIDSFLAYEVVYGVYTNPEGNFVDGITIFMEVLIGEQQKSYATPMVGDIEKALVIIKEFAKDTHKYEKLVNSNTEDIIPIKVKTKKKKLTKDDLKKRLKDALAIEDYKKAIELRDRINKLK